MLRVYMWKEGESDGGNERMVDSIKKVDNKLKESKKKKESLRESHRDRRWISKWESRVEEIHMWRSVGFKGLERTGRNGRQLAGNRATGRSVDTYRSREGLSIVAGTEPIQFFQKRRRPLAERWTSWSEDRVQLPSIQLFLDESPRTELELVLSDLNQTAREAENREIWPVSPPFYSFGGVFLILQQAKSYNMTLHISRSLKKKKNTSWGLLFCIQRN